MTDYYNRGQIEISEIATKKTSWVGKLTAAKTLIAVATPKTIGFNGTQVDLDQVDRQFGAALETYSDLQAKITSRTIEEINGNEVPKQTRRSEAQQIANDNLSSFFLGPIAAFNPSERARVLKSLQAIRVLLRGMASDDTSELNTAQDFIAQVETVPLFNTTVRPAWEAFIRTLNSPLIDGALDGLKSGNLSTLVTQISTPTEYALSRIEQIRRCKPAEPQETAISKALGTASGKSEAFRKEAVGAVNRLKNKKGILDRVV